MNAFGKVSAAIAGAALIWLGAPGQASAATLSLEGIQRVNAGGGPAANLTTQGSLDWAFWNITNTGANPLPPTNEKASAALIGSLSATGGGGVRGPSSSATITNQTYTYSDGANAPTSATNVTLGGLAFNSNLGTAAVGKGVSLSIVGNPSANEYVTLYFGGFGSVGTLTATLNGATTVTQTSQSFGTGNKQLEVYTLKFRPDSAADQLTVNWVAASVSDAVNGHVGAQAVTVSTVPEPAAIGLGGLAVAGLLTRRWRARTGA